MKSIRYLFAATTFCVSLATTSTFANPASNVVQTGKYAPTTPGAASALPGAGTSPAVSQFVIDLELQAISPLGTLAIQRDGFVKEPNSGQLYTTVRVTAKNVGVRPANAGAGYTCTAVDVASGQRFASVSGAFGQWSMGGNDNFPPNGSISADFKLLYPSYVYQKREAEINCNVTLYGKDDGNRANNRKSLRFFLP